MPVTTTAPVSRGLAASALGISINIALAVVKVLTGIVGNSYALIADGIESTADALSSLVVWGGLKVSARPADETHPYGHGKAEALAGLVVGAALLGAAVFIAVQSIHQIVTPHLPPAWFTLPVLAGVIILKWLLSRYALRTAYDIESSALRGDAWHHRADALTSAAVFFGIAIALLGGDQYAAVDDWAALLACTIIAFNGGAILLAAAHELMDVSAPSAKVRSIEEVAAGVPGVVKVEKCMARKYGLAYVVDLHVEVDGALTVREGHRIAHQVKADLLASDLNVQEVLVHVEPAPEP